MGNDNSDMLGQHIGPKHWNTDDINNFIETINHHVCGEHIGSKFIISESVIVQKIVQELIQKQSQSNNNKGER